MKTRKVPDPDVRRTWLFLPGADPECHNAGLATPADVLVIDLEDFTPAKLRPRARQMLGGLLARCHDAERPAAVRINSLDGDGLIDLEAAVLAGADMIAYPKASAPEEMQRLDAALSECASRFEKADPPVEILPVVETALGVVNTAAIARASSRIRCALLGAEDLAADLCADRHEDDIELDYARRSFLLASRAAGIEPIDAPYTFAGADGARAAARYAARLGYRCKAVVRPEHVTPVNEAFTPTEDQIRKAERFVEEFIKARERGEDRALVDGLWVEVPTFGRAQRLLDRAARLRRR